MLRADLIRPRLEYQGQQVMPVALPSNYHYLGMAADLIRLVQSYVGQRRGDLDEALKTYEGDSLDYPIIRGLASVLESRATFGNEPPVAPELIRAAMFQQGPIIYENDLFSLKTRAQALAETAIQFNITPEQVDMALFADLAEEQTLIKTGDFISPGDLIGRYNMEVARGLLYWAREMRLTVYDRYKDVFKYIKLFKLMHTITPLTDRPGYHITLHGPISPFVTSTMRYGLQFAKFLPALMLCENWHMEAEVRPPNHNQWLRYTLDEQTPLKSHFKGSGLFDSKLEADFAAEFEEKYGGAARLWELAREDELIILGDTVMIPDFSLTHRKDGRRALVEIIGYWSPAYLQRKLAKIHQAQRADLILVVYESANVAEGTFEAVSVGEVLTFAKKPVLKEIMAAAERCAKAMSNE
jgi:predicted nuclease of restriction endonuclease-like RecB superfamily